MSVILGSTAPANIMGCGFLTPHHFFLECAGIIEHKDEPSEIMEAGKALESTILALFMNHLGSQYVVWKEQPTLFHMSTPWMRATADALLLRYDRATDEERISAVELKALVEHVPTAPRVRDVIQCLHQRMVLESHFPTLERHFLVYFGGLRLGIFEIPRHQGAMDRVVREEERFLERIAQNDPPPLKAEDASVLHLRWPWSKPETVTLDDEGLLTADLIYQQTTAEIEVLKRQQDEAKAIIMAAMGPAESAVLGNRSTYTWKTAPRKGFTVAASNPRTFKRRNWEDKA